MWPHERAAIREDLESACRRAAWARARAAACPWWQPIRRLLLVLSAQADLRAADYDAKLLLGEREQAPR